jgi:hypothetical protein
MRLADASVAAPPIPGTVAAMPQARCMATTFD